MNCTKCKDPLYFDFEKSSIECAYHTLTDIRIGMPNQGVFFDKDGRYSGSTIFDWGEYVLREEGEYALYYFLLYSMRPPNL